MKLIECVESLSTHTLQKILQHHPQFTIQSEEGSTLSFLLDPNYLQLFWQKLRTDEKYVLQLFLGKIRGQVVYFSKLKEYFGSSLTEGIVGLTLLRQKGIIYTHRRFLGEVGYFLPEDLRMCFMQLLLPKNLEKNLPPRTEPLRFYECVWGILQYAKEHSLPLTQKGAIIKRQIVQLEAICRRYHISIEDVPISLSGSDHYSKTLAIILDFAIEYELLSEKDNQLVVNEEKVQHFLWLEEIERTEYVWEYLRSKLIPCYSDHERLIVDVLSVIVAGKCIEVNRLVQICDEVLQCPSFHQQLDEFSIFRLLQQFHLVDLFTEDNVTWIGRPTYLTHKQDMAYLLSNFELLVPTTIPPDVRWKIGEIADLKMYDQMITYELSKRSIERAIEFDWTVEKVLDLLHTITQNIPENVQVMLYQWFQDGSRLQFLQVTLLECNDEKLCIEIFEQSRFRKYVASVIANKYFIVYSDQLEAFKQELVQAGYTPANKIRTYRQKTDDTLYPASPIIQSALEISPKVENVYPEWEDAFPGIHTIPKSSFNNYRSYHLSSLIDLVKKSIQYHCILHFRMHDGKELQNLCPVDLDEVAGKYVLKYICLGQDGHREYEWLELGDVHEVSVQFPFP